MARLKKSRSQNKEKRYCKRCNGELEEGNFRWCNECQRRLRAEYKDSDPISDQVALHYLPSTVKDDNGY